CIVVACSFVERGRKRGGGWAQRDLVFVFSSKDLREQV
ncbi:hypothetical protein CSUI_006686, partial [Cystoisospora suis]